MWVSPYTPWVVIGACSKPPGDDLLNLDGINYLLRRGRDTVPVKWKSLDKIMNKNNRNEHPGING